VEKKKKRLIVRIEKDPTFEIKTREATERGGGKQPKRE